MDGNLHQTDKSDPQSLSLCTLCQHRRVAPKPFICTIAPTNQCDFWLICTRWRVKNKNLSTSREKQAVIRRLHITRDKKVKRYFFFGPPLPSEQPLEASSRIFPDCQLVHQLGLSLSFKCQHHFSSEELLASFPDKISQIQNDLSRSLTNRN